MTASRRACLAACLFLLPATALAGVELIGSASFPGTDTDRSELKDKLGDVPHNRLGGLGSGIAWTGQADRYVMVSDRGPQDGAVPFKCRVHLVDVNVRPGKQPAVELSLKETILLTDTAGRPLVGASGALKAEKDHGIRFDPEDVRVTRAGSYLISDEYGPAVVEFDPRGKWMRSANVPKRFLPVNPAAEREKELPPHNAVGRQPNAGFESLAVSPDGKRLYALLQGPLIQDNGTGPDGKNAGINCRLLEGDLATGKTRELVYPLDDPKYGVCSLVAVNDHEFLALERDAEEGTTAAFKRIFRVDIAGATDVSDVDSLPAKGLPETIKPVKKTPFLDLLDPKFKIAGPEAPRKFEGLTFGPDLDDNRHLLLVSTDNDFRPEVPTTVYAFAVGRADLPGYVPQQFPPPDAVTVSAPQPDAGVKPGADWRQDPFVWVAGIVLVGVGAWLLLRRFGLSVAGGPSASG